MNPQVPARPPMRHDVTEDTGPWSILPLADTFCGRRASTTTRLGMPFPVGDHDDILVAAEAMTGASAGWERRFWQVYVSSTDSGITYSAEPRPAREEVQKLRDEVARRTRLTREQIARAVGVDRRSLSDWVKGGATPGKEKLERLRMLADVIRDIDATEPGRSTEVVLRRSDGQDLLDHIAAGHLRRAGDWPMFMGTAPSVTITRRPPAKPPLHQKALEACLRGELAPLGRSMVLRPESAYEQDPAEAERLMPAEPERRGRRGYR